MEFFGEEARFALIYGEVVKQHSLSTPEKKISRVPRGGIRIRDAVPRPRRFLVFYKRNGKGRLHCGHRIAGPFISTLEWPKKPLPIF